MPVNGWHCHCNVRHKVPGHPTTDPMASFWPQVVQALTLVRAECMQVLRGCLFNLPKTRTMRLEDFEDMQLKA